MAFVTGTATSLADLLSAVQTACVDHGWTLVGNVLSKGACFMRLSVVSGGLQVLGGTGQDGSDALTGAAPNPAYIGKPFSVSTLTFPLTYNVHVLTAPDEVYLVINYEVSLWQWIAFGCSPVEGLPGTGNWFGGSWAYNANGGGCYITSGGGGANNFAAQCPALFWANSGVGNAKGSYVHHGFDGGGWSGNNWTGSDVSSANALYAQSVHISRLPSVWNGETVFPPIQPLVARPPGQFSITCDLAHARYARNDNYADGAIITLGPDRWKIYPWWVKNSAARDGGNGVLHTGTLAWVIRYDGP